MNLSGFSAVYPGYSAQENSTAETEKNQAAAKEAANKLLGAQVLGRALTGAQPPPAPNPGQPLAPNPGQASVPNQPPMQPPQAPQGYPTQQAAPAMGPGVASQPAQGPVGAPVAQGGGGMPEMTLQSLVQRIIQTTPQVQGHPEIMMAALERAAPLLDRASKDQLYELRQEMQKQALASRENIVRMQQENMNQRNAASTDARIYSADQGADARRYSADKGAEARKYSADTVAHSRELSNEARRDVAQLSAETRREIAARSEQGKTDRAELSVGARKEIAQLNSDTRREITGMMEAGRERRADQTSEDRRYSTDARSATATEAETGRNIRAESAEGGRMRRAEMSLETKAAMQRLSQAARAELEDQRQAGSDRRAELSANTRRELASQSIEARQAITQYVEAGRNDRAAATQQGQNDRTDARLERTDRRLDQGDTRIAAQAAAATVRQDQTYQRLELQKAQLEQRALDTGDKYALSQWRAVVDAQHKRAQEIINASQAGMPKKEKKALLDEQNAAYMAAIVGMRRRIENPGAAPAGAPPEAAPAPAGAAPAATGTPPINLLTAGQPTEFKNGQVWTLENGQPKRLK